MPSSTPSTPGSKTSSALISAGLGERLRIYLQFRHVFRQAYSFQLHWEKMAPLVLGSEETLALLLTETAAFVSAMDSR